MRTFVEGVVGRNVDEETVVEKLLLLNSVAAGAAGHQRGVDAVVLHRIDDVARHQLLDLQLHMGIVVHESRQELVQQVGRDGRDDAQTQPPRYFALQLGDRFADIVVGPQRLAGPFQHHLARLGGDHGFLRTVEQDDAQLLFERFDLHTQRRLRHETVFGGQRKTPAIGYCQQVFQLNDGHRRRDLFCRANI